MFCRLLFISILNIFLCQAFFNKTIGNEIGFKSARSLAIGETHFMNSNTSDVSLRNPARLGLINIPQTFKMNSKSSGNQWNSNINVSSIGLKIDYNFLGSMYSERRSIDLKDFFGGFLNEGDYVLNNSFNNYHHFGLISNIKLLSANIGFALCRGPWSSIDYYYEEEVRGSDPASSLVRDPIRGYHILEHKGKINLTSAGFGIALNNFLSFGVSINHIHDGKYDYKLKVIQLEENSSQNLASVLDVDESSNFEGNRFHSMSSILNHNNFEISLGYEENAEIKSSNPDFAYFPITFSSGLPFYLVPVVINEEAPIAQIHDPSKLPDFINEDFDLVYWDSFYIEKPERIKFGFNYKLGTNKYSRLFSFQIIENKFKNNKLLENYYEFNLGIEHVKYDKIFRAGLSYKESPFLTSYFSPLTTFSFGTAKKVNKLIFDIAASYSYQKYQYHDLFPVSGDNRATEASYFDRIHESNWRLVSTVSYKF